MSLYSLPKARASVEPEVFTPSLLHEDISNAQTQSFPLLLGQETLSGTKRQGSCVGCLAQSKGGMGRGHRKEHLLTSHKTFLFNQKSGSYFACWSGLGIQHNLRHPFKENKNPNPPVLLLTLASLVRRGSNQR